MANTLDVGFLNPFIDGALNTLKVQCGMEARPGKPFRKAGEEGVIVDIAGVIGITSPSFKGSISIAFPAKTFLGIMEKMLGEKFETITKDVEDGAGELLNMIYGAAKTVLNTKGYALEKALPSVVTGRGVHVRQLTAAPIIVVPFETEVGAFQIEICLEPATQAAA